MIIKYRVWCEFEINGKIEKCMESPASWFLLTQTGKLLESGPVVLPQPLSKAYIKAIPLFYTGCKDKNGKDIYEGDIVKLYEHHQPEVVEYCGSIFGVFLYKTKKRNNGTFQSIDEWCPIDCPIEVIGNIYENGDLL